MWKLLRNFFFIISKIENQQQYGNDCPSSLVIYSNYEINLSHTVEKTQTVAITFLQQTTFHSTCLGVKKCSLRHDHGHNSLR